MFGRTKFSTDPASHGLQVAHSVILSQWQKKDGDLAKQVIWPLSAATSPILYPLP